jgi:hypothetical protein
VSAAATGKYTVVFDTASTGPTVISATVSGGYLGWVVPALDDGTVACRVKDRGVQSECWKASATATYDDAIDGAPAEEELVAGIPATPVFSYSNGGIDVIDFEWEPGEGGGTPAEYNVHITGGDVDETCTVLRGDYLGAGIYDGSTVWCGDETEFSADGTVVMDTTYTATITAVNDDGTSPPLVIEVDTMESTDVPSMPSWGGTASHGTLISKTWSPPAWEGTSPIVSYTVTITGPGLEETVSVPADQTLSFSVLGNEVTWGDGGYRLSAGALTPLTTYTLSVTAVNASGTSPAAVEEVTTGPE